MSCLNPEEERSLSRQVSTDEAERAGIRTRVGGIMMMHMARPAVQGRRRINLTPEASRSMDGRKGTQGTQGSTNGPRKKKKLRSPNPGSLTIATPAQRARIGTPPLLEYRVQGATTHTEATGARTSAHTHIISHAAGVQPTCNQRTGPVQRHTRPFLCCSIGCRCKIHVNKRQWVVPRIFVSGACTCTGLVLADR